MFSKTKILTIAFLFLFTNCAVYNTSTYQNAETCRRGHVRIGYGIGTGIDLTVSSLITKLSDLSDTTNVTFSDLPSRGKINHQIDFGIGVTNSLEFNFKYWRPLIRGNGIRTGVKYRFGDKKQKLKIAIMPGISGMINKEYTDSSNMIGDTYVLPQSVTISLELPVIFNIKTSRYVDFYFIPLLCIHRIDIKKWILPELEQTYYINRIGFNTGISLKADTFFIRPEVGFNLLGDMRNFNYFTFTGGLGLGFEL